jgi:hypothetical protein
MVPVLVVTRLNFAVSPRLSLSPQHSVCVVVFISPPCSVVPAVFDDARDGVRCRLSETRKRAVVPPFVQKTCSVVPSIISPDGFVWSTEFTRRLVGGDRSAAWSCRAS